MDGSWRESGGVVGDIDSLRVAGRVPIRYLRPQPGRGNVPRHQTGRGRVPSLRS